MYSPKFASCEHDTCGFMSRAEYCEGPPSEESRQDRRRQADYARKLVIGLLKNCPDQRLPDMQSVRNEQVVVTIAARLSVADVKAIVAGHYAPRLQLDIQRTESPGSDQHPGEIKVVTKGIYPPTPGLDRPMELGHRAYSLSFWPKDEVSSSVKTDKWVAAEDGRFGPCGLPSKAMTPYDYRQLITTLEVAYEYQGLCLEEVGALDSIYDE